MRLKLASLALVLLCLGMFGQAPPLVGRHVVCWAGDGCAGGEQYVAQHRGGGYWFDLKHQPQPGNGSTYAGDQMMFRACCEKGGRRLCSLTATNGSPVQVNEMRTLWKFKKHKASDVAAWNEAHAGG